MLRIVKITEAINSGAFLAEDVFSGETVELTLSGKMRMVFDRDFLEPGDECVAVCSPYEPERCRLTIPSHFKMDNTNDGWNAQARLKKQYTEEIGPYNVNQYWIKKAPK